MRNTAERNISAMSVKWKSKELANPRVLSVIYDGEPITSGLSGCGTAPPSPQGEGFPVIRIDTLRRCAYNKTIFAMQF